MRANKSEVVVVLDRSGSMSGSETDMEGGFKTFLDKQKSQPGECYVSLYSFDDTIENVFETRNIQEVKGLKLVPRGSTALFDAVGYAIERVGARLAATPEDERPETVIVMILTDGGENASKTFTGERVRAMVKHQTDKYNWKFIFLGGDLDAAQTAATVGVYAANSLSFSKSAKGYSNTWNIMASGVSCMRAAPAAATYCFSEQDRSSAMEK